MEIIDHETGEVIFEAETYSGGVVNDLYDGNNVYLLKYYNANLEPQGGFDYYVTELILGARLWVVNS